MDRLTEQAELDVDDYLRVIDAIKLLAKLGNDRVITADHNHFTVLGRLSFLVSQEGSPTIN